MEPIAFVFGLIFLGSVTGIVRMVIQAVTGGGGKHKVLAAELSAANDRARLLETQLLDARLQNDQVQKQLEWHTKMLETQDRLVKHMSDSSARTPVGSVR